MHREARPSPNCFQTYWQEDFRLDSDGKCRWIVFSKKFSPAKPPWPFTEKTNAFSVSEKVSQWKWDRFVSSVVQVLGDRTLLGNMYPGEGQERFSCIFPARCLHSAMYKLVRGNLMVKVREHFGSFCGVLCFAACHRTRKLFGVTAYNQSMAHLKVMIGDDRL